MNSRRTLKAWVKEHSKALYSQRYNTCNGWGFGGSFGTEYRLSDGKTFVRLGTASYRHAGTEPIAYTGEKLGPKDSDFRSLPIVEFLARVGKEAA